MLISKDISRLSEKDRYLYIDMRPLLDVELKYSPWEEGLKIYRHTNNAWEIDDTDPNLPLLGYEHESDPDLPIYQFIRSIPDDIRRIVSHFDHLQTKMLQILAVSNTARDLVLDTPLLLWLVVDYAENSNIAINDIKKLLKKKRVEILTQVIGVQSSEVDIQFLKKIILCKFRYHQLDCIKHHLYSNRTSNFMHWHEIPYYVLVLLKKQTFELNRNWLLNKYSKMFSEREWQRRKAEREEYYNRPLPFIRFGRNKKP